MPRTFHHQLLLAQGLEKVVQYLEAGINGRHHPVYPAEIEINLMFGNPTISDGGATAQGSIESAEAIRKATLLREFLLSPTGRQAIICTEQNAYDLNWVSTSSDEIYLCHYDEQGWSKPNYILTTCRFHTYRLRPA